MLIAVRLLLTNSTLQSFLIFVYYLSISMSVDIGLPIQLAAKRAGLTPHVIRAWEKRYDAVSPDRTDSNRRLYSEDEVERLRLLGVLTRSGHRIGDIARLPTEALREQALSADPVESTQTELPPSQSQRDTIGSAIDAVQRMDAAALQSVLERNAVALGQRGLLERFMSPLARRIGELWANGTLTAAHEHFASNELRYVLLRTSRAFIEGANAPLAIVTTPSGQLHELGAAIVAASARDLGWRVLYLGPNLPAADIANVATVNHAKLVALSIVYPGDDPDLPGELALLRRLLPTETELIAGGAAANSYRSALETTGMMLIDDLGEFSRYLAQARLPPVRS